MRRLIVRGAAFALLNGAVALGLLALVDSRYSFQQWETDSILLSTPRDADVGVVIMGTSRARVLTRVKCNWECLERELGERVFNLAIPFGGGIVPEKMYLENFYACGNRAKTILFFVDPFTLFSPQPNKQHRFVYYEPLRPGFLWKMLTNGIPAERILIYVQSKFTYRWFTQEAGVVGCDNEVILDAQTDPEKVRKRTESLYFDGLNETYFQRYFGVLEEIVDLARERGSRVVLAFPPTLLGPQPGGDRLLAELAELRKSVEFEFYDFTDAIPDVRLYGDYDHLNSSGVQVFAAQFLKPALASSRNVTTPVASLID